MADWYYAKDGERQGPVSSAQLRQMAQSGALVPTDMVFKEGGKEWIAASTVKDLFSGASGRSSSTPPARAEAEAGSLSFGDSGGGGRGGGDEDDGASYRPSRRRSGGFGEILMFRRMISPFFIQLLFWLGVVSAVLGGLIVAVGVFISDAPVIYRAEGAGVLLKVLVAVCALVFIPFSILLYRFIAEVAILTFRIHDRLTEIADLLRKQNRS